jgi:hypothetical protein
MAGNSKAQWNRLLSFRGRSSLFRQVLLAGLTFLLFLTVNQATAQTPTPNPQVPATNPPASGSTSDYLPEALQLLFPSVPAPLDLADTEAPIFPSDAPSFDLLSLGVLPDPANANATPLTKTITLNLGGGIRGRVFADPAWLAPVPDRFINPKDQGKLQIQVMTSQDAGQGAGLLPAQTNWGRLRLSLNGALFDYAVPLVVGSPKIGRNDGDRVFGLYNKVATRLDALGDLDFFIGSPSYPNASQVALGLVVDYLGEKQYNGRLPETDFVDRVAETLSQKDYNNDGWAGFKPEDIVIGAPGWVLGKKVK